MICPNCSYLSKCETNYCVECGFSYLRNYLEEIEVKNETQWQHIKIVLLFFSIYFTSFYSILIFPFFSKTFLGYDIVNLIALDIALTFFFIAGVEKTKEIFRFNLLKSIMAIAGGVVVLVLVGLLYKKSIILIFHFDLFNGSIVGLNALTYSHLLYLCLLPAISEEIAFRSFIYEKLKLVVSRFDAVVLTSILFAMIHLQLQMFIFHFFAGIVFCWVKDYTKSVIPCMILHFLFNLLIIIFSFYIT